MASLTDSNSFDFKYVQSYLIKNHLLGHMKINYHDIHHTYLCLTKDKQTINNDQLYSVTDLLSNNLHQYQIEDDHWNYLNDVMLDKMYDGLHVLKRVALVLKDELKEHTNIEINFSSMYLYTFISQYFHQQKTSLLDTLNKCEIQDFPLCYLDQVRHILENRISGYEHLFTDISELLRVPISNELKETLEQNFQLFVSNLNSIDDTKQKMEIITGLLDDLTQIENYLLRQSSLSLLAICNIMNSDNPLDDRNKSKIWCESFMDNDSKSRFAKLLYPIDDVNCKDCDDDEKSLINLFDSNEISTPYMTYPITTNNTTNDNFLMINIPDDETNENTILLDKPKRILFDGKLNTSTTINNLTPLVEIRFKTVDKSAISSNKLFNLLKQVIMPKIDTNLYKANKYYVLLPNGEQSCFICKLNKFSEKIRQLLLKYNLSQHCLVDSDGIVIDHLVEQHANVTISSNCEIIEKSCLLDVYIHFSTSNNVSKYSVKRTINIEVILLRVIVNHPEETDISNTCITNEYGLCIDSGEIEMYLSKHIDNTVKVYINNLPTIFYQLEFIIPPPIPEKTSILFLLPTSKWQQSHEYLKMTMGIMNFRFLKEMSIINNDDTILSVLSDHHTATIYVLISADIVESTWTDIMDLYTPDDVNATEFNDYLAQTHVDISLYGINIWNVHDAIINDLPRTNNHVEGYNSRLESNFPKHPHIYHFIELNKFKS
ncbi:unnamed protein product [Didymodactylos carnosus]|uniref:Uncharacterized protein n=1 Tax=Didymodactylos carnosus TaxID=1234261 RepID=A0A814AWS4_9BILA|nr:unnamed protein product [Didymodactylos carnosus]CAF3700029.1 unnamed protein product [Didymodactylos carnosus]